MEKDKIKEDIKELEKQLTEIELPAFLKLQKMKMLEQEMNILPILFIIIKIVI